MVGALQSGRSAGSGLVGNKMTRRCGTGGGLLPRSLSDMRDEARIEYPKRAEAWSEETAGEQSVPRD